MSNHTLFRQQVLNRNSGLDGALLLRTPPFFKLISLSALLTAALILALLAQGRYSARLSVPGYLHSASSVLQVTATRDGRLGRVFVTPLSEVLQGQPLFELLAMDDSTSTQALDSQQLEKLQQRRELLDQKHLALAQARTLRTEAMDMESALLEEQQRHLVSKQHLLAQQLAFRTGQEKKILSLAGRGYLPEQDLARSGEQVLLGKLDLLELQQHISSNTHRQNAIRQQRSIDAADWNALQFDISAQKSLLETQALQLQKSMARTVFAPHDGKVGEIHVYPGNQVSGRQTVISLYRTGEPLLAELAIPARLIPVISTGLEVRMILEDKLVPTRAEIRGTLVEISATPLSAGSKMGPLTLLETSFRARVLLNPLPAQFDGDTLSGIHRIVSAQLIGPSRSLIQWLLRPLQQLKQSVA